MDSLSRSDRAAELARAVVRIFAETMGRGPTKARAHLCDDVVCVVLRDTLTKTERRLLEHGGAAELAAARTTLMDSCRTELEQAVAAILGREVESLHVDHQLQVDVVAVTVVFASS